MWIRFCCELVRANVANSILNIVLIKSLGFGRCFVRFLTFVYKSKWLLHFLVHKELFLAIVSHDNLTRLLNIIRYYGLRYYCSLSFAIMDYAIIVRCYSLLWIMLLLFVVIRYYGLRYNYRLLLLVMFNYANWGDYAVLGRCYSIWLITLSSAGSGSPAGCL